MSWKKKMNGKYSVDEGVKNANVIMYYYQGANFLALKRTKKRRLFLAPKKKQEKGCKTSKSLAQEVRQKSDISEHRSKG